MNTKAQVVLDSLAATERKADALIADHAGVPAADVQAVRTAAYSLNAKVAAGLPAA